MPRRAAIRHLVAIAAVAGTSGLAGPTAPAGADPVGDRLDAQRRQAERVISRIDGSRRALEPVIQRYDLASERLSETKSAIAENTERLETASDNLGRAQYNLAMSLVRRYKNPEPDAFSLVLSARSIEGALAELELYDRANGYNSRTLIAIRHYRIEKAQRQRALTKQREVRTRAFGDQQAARTRIESTIAANRRYLRSLRRDIKRLVAEKRRQERLAAERAERLARAALARYRVTYGGGIGGSAAGAGIVLPPGNSLGVQAVRIAMRYLGTPYVWGGEQPGGFDCSGLTQFSYAQVGISLPRVTYQQIRTGVAVPRTSLAPGDLVFFNNAHHMGMYIGAGNMVHAPHTGDVVKVSSLNIGWYAATYIGAVRVTR